MIDNETSLVEMANRLNANYFSVVKKLNEEISKLKSKNNSIIAELRALVQYDQSAHEYYPITAEKILAVLDEYEVKG